MSLAADAEYTWMLAASPPPGCATLWTCAGPEATASEAGRRLRAAAAGPAGKVVVLGLVTTKTARLEPLEQILARLREASALIDAERLALSPQCGFATSVAGNAITAEAQRAKLALLVRAAWDFLPA